MARMGVTTAVGGQCGACKYHPADYLDIVDRDGAAINVAMMAGHGFFRSDAGHKDIFGMFFALIYYKTIVIYL